MHAKHSETANDAFKLPLTQSLLGDLAQVKLQVLLSPSHPNSPKPTTPTNHTAPRFYIYKNNNG
jgi:hypothetical protein